MVSVILAISVLAGYRFVYIYKKTRFQFIKKKDQHIYFYSALYGLFIFIPSVLIIAIISMLLDWERFYGSIGKLTFSNFNDCLKIHAKMCFSSDPTLQNIFLIFILFLVACYAPILLNKFITEEKNNAFYRKAIRNMPFELLLYDSAYNYTPLMITLDNDRFYFGFIANENTSLNRKTISIIPLLSGYRSNKNELKFTTNYYEIYTANQKTMSENDYDVFLNNMKKIIIVERVTSVSKFDTDLYEKKFKPTK